MANGKVYFVTPNAHLLALDATNGTKVWEKTIGDVRAGESATIAPLVVKNTLITGSSGGSSTSSISRRSRPGRRSGIPRG